MEEVPRVARRNSGFHARSRHDFYGWLAEHHDAYKQDPAGEQ